MNHQLIVLNCLEPEINHRKSFFEYVIRNVNNRIELIKNGQGLEINPEVVLAGRMRFQLFFGQVYKKKYGKNVRTSRRILMKEAVKSFN